LVNVGPTPLLSLPFELRENGQVVRVRVTFNVEQALDRLEVEEGHDEVVITAWVGWKTGAVHLRNPRVTAAGSVIRFHEVVLAEPLAQRPTH
jgi:hypothetical protein